MGNFSYKYVENDKSRNGYLVATAGGKEIDMDYLTPVKDFAAAMMEAISNGSFQVRRSPRMQEDAPGALQDVPSVRKGENLLKELDLVRHLGEGFAWKAGMGDDDGNGIPDDQENLAADQSQDRDVRKPQEEVQKHVRGIRF